MSEKTMKFVHICRCVIYCAGFAFTISTLKACHPPQCYLIYTDDNKDVDKENFWPADLVPHPNLPDPTPESDPTLS